MATSIIKSRPDYIVNRQTITDTGSYSGRNNDVAVDTITGYTPIGVAGWEELSFGTVYFYALWITGARIKYAWKNTNGESIQNHHFSVNVLYKKNG